MSDPRPFFLLLFAALAAARLCHSDIVWAEEGLPLAAALQMQFGKALYRDIWFDKPPLLPAFYLLWGAHTGWPLRLAGALYDLLACAAAWRFARDLWGPREARLGASLMGFFLIFGIPSAVTPLAADLLMIAPHVLAVWLAWRGRSWLSGMAAGVAFLINPKGLFVALACVLWRRSGPHGIALGFAAVVAAGAAWLWSAGALEPYYEQVWQWGSLYAAQTFVADPWRNGLLRTLNWMGFHAALVVAAVFGLGSMKAADQRWKWFAWAALGLLAAAAGVRFFPRYFFHLLPVLVLLAARGFVLMPRRYAAAAALLLVVPLIRFGPRYFLLASGQESEWDDTAIDRDSRRAARITTGLATPGDTLFVWGFRPEIYAYTRLRAATRFLESQPLTGVPADRHLTSSRSIESGGPEARRAELARSHPTFVVDGLGSYNPAMAIGQYPDLQPWMAGYIEVARTKHSVIYRARP